MLPQLYYSEFLSQLHFLGVAGMPRRITDYPDAFHIFNKIASWGSYASAFSVLIFFWVMVDALIAKSNKSA